MILNKSKHHFWSQLLISMIAMFALPEVQSIQQTEYAREYQNQSVQQQVTIYQVQQQSLQLEGYSRPTLIRVKLTEFTPLFVTQVRASHAPIRGSPTA